ncbi:G protein-coupled receptor 182 [Homo sapiens]|uniref:G protein-coupled receptor 182 n=1 Tax=Homo sapiens TaxID=9606 RepID=Q7Z4H2_HUMAN|nr:HBcAg-binding protein [Homo sapiens]KAI2566468.1 G protein-coupled receptor 182 [Homo sapiens]KAI4066717.1 G protein-coupled receptor 182 [Homo sapiens]
MISEGGWGWQGWGRSQGLRPAPCSWVSRMVSPPAAIQETQLHFLADTLPSPLSILLPPHKQEELSQSQLLIADLLPASDLGNFQTSRETQSYQKAQPTPISFSPDHRKVSRDVIPGAALGTASSRCWQMLCPSPSVPGTRWGRPQWKLLNSVTGQSSDTVISQFSLAMSFPNFPVPQLRFLNTCSTDETKKSSVNK